MSKQSLKSFMSGFAVLLLLVGAIIVFRVRENFDKSIDLQIIVRLVSISVSLIIGLVFIWRSPVLFKKIYPWIAFCMLLTLSAAWSANVQYSFVAASSQLAMLCMIAWGTSDRGETGMAYLLILSGLAVAILSIAVYFYEPALGRMEAWLGASHGYNSRMRGVAGSANGLGSIAALSLLLVLMYWPKLSTSERWISALTVVLCAYCLVMSDNRASMASILVLGLIWIVLAGTSWFRIGIALCLVAVGTLFVVFFLDIATFPTLLSRSGDVAELESLTGRTEIWQVALERILAKPLVGYGYSTSGFYLLSDPRLFEAAAHCHNLYLEILFSVGVIGLIGFVAAMAAILKMAVSTRSKVAIFLLTFYLVRGLTEPSPFSGPASFGSAVFFFAITSVAVASMRRRALTYMPQRATSGSRA